MMRVPMDGESFEEAIAKAREAANKLYGIASRWGDDEPKDGDE